MYIKIKKIKSDDKENFNFKDFIHLKNVLYLNKSKFKLRFNSTQKIFQYT